MNEENGLLGSLASDEEEPKTLLGWLKAASPAVKILVTAGLIIILSNVLIIFYVSAVMSGANVDSSGRDETPVNRQPVDGRESLNELDFEKHFVDDYEKSMLVSGRLLQLVDFAAERDRNWQQALSVDITLLKTLANGSQEVVPPNSPGYIAIHEVYLKAFADFKWAADNLMPAVSTNDAELQDSCVQRLNKGRERMNQAIQNLKDVYSGN